jgi:hypothetical protein
LIGKKGNKGGGGKKPEQPKPAKAEGGEEQQFKFNFGVDKGAEGRVPAFDFGGKDCKF